MLPTSSSLLLLLLLLLLSYSISFKIVSQEFPLSLRNSSIFFLYSIASLIVDDNVVSGSLCGDGGDDVVGDVFVVSIRNNCPVALESDEKAGVVFWRLFLNLLGSVK